MSAPDDGVRPPSDNAGDRDAADDGRGTDTNGVACYMLTGLANDDVDEAGLWAADGGVDLVSSRLDPCD